MEKWTCLPAKLARTFYTPPGIDLGWRSGYSTTKFGGDITSPMQPDPDRNPGLPKPFWPSGFSGYSAARMIAAPLSIVF